MKTGRLELFIYDGKCLRHVWDANGNPIKCETHPRMEELMEKYLPRLKDGESFVVKENW